LPAGNRNDLASCWPVVAAPVKKRRSKAVAAGYWARQGRAFRQEHGDDQKTSALAIGGPVCLG